VKAWYEQVGTIDAAAVPWRVAAVGARRCPSLVPERAPGRAGPLDIDHRPRQARWPAQHDRIATLPCRIELEQRLLAARQPVGDATLLGTDMRCLVAGEAS